MRQEFRKALGIAIMLVSITCAAGAKWKLIGSFPPGLPTAGFFWNANSGIVGVTTNWRKGGNSLTTLYKTNDGGKTWTAMLSPSSGISGDLTSIFMTSPENGWLTVDVTDIADWDTDLGVYSTTDGGYTWTPVPHSMQWNCIYQTKGGTIYKSNGGIGAFSDSICVDGDATDPSENLNFHGGITSDGGKTWTNKPFLDEAWGLYLQKITGTIFSYPEADAHLWSSTDTGKSWLALAGITTSPCPNYINTGDIEGSGLTLYVQGYCAAGMYRSTDQGHSWQAVGGPSNDRDTRFCVPPTCNGGTVIAFDQAGGVWETTDGGDGMLPDSQNETIISVSQIPSVKPCNASKGLAKIITSSCPNGFVLQIATLEQDTIHFSLDSVPDLPLNFGGGTSDSFYIRFDPNRTAGTFTTRLELTGIINRPDTALPFDTVITVTATALPVPPQLAYSPISADFGSISTCHGFGDTSIVFTNTGCASDTITSDSIFGAGFLILDDSLPIIVQPGDSVSLHYQFIPPDSGTFSGTVKLHVTSMGLSEDPVISLTGRGVQGMGVLDVRSTSLQAGSFSFCNGDTVLTDTLRNTGCDTLVISGMKLAGDSAFSLVSIPQDSLLLPGASEIVTIGFAPRVKGQQSATISFHERNIVNDPGRDTTIITYGIGLPGQTALSLDTTTRDFGNLFECQQGDTTIWLRNPDCDTLTLDSASFSNSDYALAGPLPAHILPGDSVSVTISLIPNNPTNPSSDNGSVMFYSNATDGPGTETVPLQAAIIPPAKLHVGLEAPTYAGHDGNMATFYVILTGDTGLAASYLKSIAFDLTHNDDLLSYLSASGVTRTGTGGTPALQVDSFTWSAGSSASGHTDTIGTLSFRAYLAKDSITPLTLSNISYSTPGFAPECIASIDDSGSGFQYLYNCGDHELQKFMRTGEVGLAITSVVPNPAGASLRVQGIGYRVQGLDVQMFDGLGNCVLNQNSPASEQDVRSTSLRSGYTLYPTPYTLTLDVSNLPSGIYFLRLSSGGYSVSRSVAIER